MTKLTTILGQIDAAHSRQGWVDEYLLVEAIKEMAAKFDVLDGHMMQELYKVQDQVQALEHRLPAEKETRG